MARLFLLGATGHIGGAVLDAITLQNPGVEIRALVRDRAKASQVEKRHGAVKVAVGDLQDLDLISNESKLADVVINTSPDLVPGSHAAIKASLNGLSSRAQKGFYIQTSGAFLVAEDTGGTHASERVWNDMADISRIKATPPTSYHYATDRLVREAAGKVNVAIVSPAVVYGLSASSDNPTPVTLRDIVAAVKALGAGFTLSQGNNILSYVHVKDLARIYAALLRNALKSANDFDARLWGTDAYYFASSEELSFGDYMRHLVKILMEKNVLRDDTIRTIKGNLQGPDLQAVREAAAAHGCGVNVRCRSTRARNMLGWKVNEQSVLESLSGVVDAELLRAA